MQMIYDSDTFVVLHLTPELPLSADGATVIAQSATEPLRHLQRQGFEIVDKRSGKELYLDGVWAEMFHQKIQAWQTNNPTEEEVEETLDRYTGLAQHPVIVH
ncbi:MAG: DUF3567 domain-containing protein [Comamonas sp.]|jgi:hypothetical protein